MPPSKCEFILINGKNRGKPCGKKYCKNHQQKQEIIVEKIEEKIDSDSEEDREKYNYEESEDGDGIRKIEQHINTDFNDVLKKQCEGMGLILTDEEKEKLIKTLLKMI
jgi:hypothetical protein